MAANLLRQRPLLDLPSTLIRHGAKTELCENTLETGGLCTRRLCVLVWTENSLKIEIFENDVMTLQ